MKKTIIALAVIASVSISGSAMAWTASGIGGNVEFGGLLLPLDKVTPWEVETGAAVNDLNATLVKGSKSVTLAVTKPIPVLGIRTILNSFTGLAGFSPQISYGGAINPDQFSNSRAPLTLIVRNEADVEIGTLETSLIAVAQASKKNDGDTANNSLDSLYSPQAGIAFFGGLPKVGDTINNTSPLGTASMLFPGVTDNFTDQGIPHIEGKGTTSFNDENAVYSGYYASGIMANETIKITLADVPMLADIIKWKASLPITVSYM